MIKGFCFLRILVVFHGEIKMIDGMKLGQLTSQIVWILPLGDDVVSINVVIGRSIIDITNAVKGHRHFRHVVNA